MTIHEVLKSYWGYDEFRPLQQDIVEAVLAGNDTLALLPTGGGKSICFQVPAMAMNGLCLVVSPLIALMKDQVANLQSKGIAAQAIYSGLSQPDIQLILNNCVHGGVKFLYLSPERLGSDLLKSQLLQMNICLLAIDEAHCISQWGYDFRPEYRKIKEVRELFPDVPVLALTASATAAVVEDIQSQLGFKKKLAFRKSFERLNLHYIVRYHENKLEKMLNAFQMMKGSGLVYVRNRKLAEELADYLVQNGLNASFYHAGLMAEERQVRQDNWIKNKTRIMVCTNAFGMGIDKPDCKLVVHYQIPDCLEAYYQEAGRAGRNGNAAYCLLLYHHADAHIMRAKLTKQFPEPEFLAEVYNHLGSYFQVAVGQSSEQDFTFDLPAFAQQVKLPAVSIFNALKLLSQLELLQVNEAINLPSRIRFSLKGNELYQFQQTSQIYSDLLQLLLRSYGGIFDYDVAIAEKNLAMQLNVSESTLRSYLIKLQELNVLEYLPQINEPSIRFMGPRLAKQYLPVNDAFIKFRKKMEFEKLEAMIAYAENTSLCRSRVLLKYFDELNVMDCGVCDVCKEKIGKYWTEEKLATLCNQLRLIDWEKAYSIKELLVLIPHYRDAELATACRILIDKGILQLNLQQQIVWANRRG
ncbi:MAG: RecQ family ATP-dependent DNA helicase [Bacteroidota bacterium]|nr:RecQ family ATP-dependent DNA helicase [Bacteroidota bacterium]